MSAVGRPATGTVKWIRGSWHTRISLGGGARKWVPLDPSIPHSDEARAKAGAR